MSRKKGMVLSEMELEANKAAEEMDLFRNMSDDWSDFSNSDMDPSYSIANESTASESDYEPQTKKRRHVRKGGMLLLLLL